MLCGQLSLRVNSRRVQDFETFLRARNRAKQRARELIVSSMEKTDHIQVIPPHMNPEAFEGQITQIIYESEKYRASRQ